MTLLTMESVAVTLHILSIQRFRTDYTSECDDRGLCTNIAQQKPTTVPRHKCQSVREGFKIEKNKCGIFHTRSRFHIFHFILNLPLEERSVRKFHTSDLNGNVCSCQHKAVILYLSKSMLIFHWRNVLR